MTCLQLLMIAFGLSMDAFAVSVTNGLCCTVSKRQIAATGLCFGGFQGMMPMIGFLLGMAFETYISALDHYIALLLLGYIGGRMLLDAIRHGETAAVSVLNGRLLLMQGLATSVDALAVGISFAALSDVRIVPAALLIAAVTCLCSMTGVCFGRHFGKRLGSYAQLIGGLLLIGVGVKIFCEHTLLTK